MSLHWSYLPLFPADLDFNWLDHTPQSSPVKLEPDDSDASFVMELSHSERKQRSSVPPPAQVPLRATQASKEMRLMMGVFRLNPFAIHSFNLNGDGESLKENALPSPPPSWCGEVGPLEEEPILIEFQLDLNDSIKKDDPDPDDPHVPTFSAQDESQLHSFSPEFELQPSLHQDENQESNNDVAWEHIDYEQHHHPHSVDLSSTAVWSFSSSLETPRSSIGAHRHPRLFFVHLVPSLF